MAIKIIHLSDIHYSPRNADKVLLSLNTSLRTGKEKGVDLWVLAAELFDHSINNTTAGGFPHLNDIITQMMDLAPVVAVYGTVTHDIPGCYDVFTRIKARHNFTILEAGKAYHLMGKHDTKNLYLSGKDISDEYSTLLVMGCPEPQKSWFLRNKSMGRDEANEAITRGMRKILLGMGAIRKQHSNIPCIFVYHGTMTGAKMCNGQLMKPGAIEIGRDDLAMVGADYIALGHIHRAQGIPGLPAYYGGSVFPVNWGELEQKTFNYIVIDKNPKTKSNIWIKKDSIYYVSIQQISFPHPPMKKVITKWSDCKSWIVKSERIKGFKIWRIIQATKEERKEIDCDAILEKMLSYGALPGSRVSIEDIPPETIRTAGITKAHGLIEKLKIYNEDSASTSIDMESVFEKAHIIENEATQTGHNTKGAHWRLVWARIRGCIGIWKGQGKKEVFLDLEKLGPGIFALIGKNGAGKTPLLDNLQPYLCMMSRPGKLQDHFYLKDSFRELFYVDDLSGDNLRILIQIDGKSKPGKVDTFIYKNKQSLTNERIADYEEKLFKIFGSQRLFTLSCFMAQFATKANPEIKDSPKGDKKRLFAELAGLSFYQVYSDNAKKKAETIEKGLEENKIKLGMYKDTEKGLEEKKGEIEKALNCLEFNTEDLKDIKNKGKQLSTELDDLQEKEKERLRIKNEKEKELGIYLGTMKEYSNFIIQSSHTVDNYNSIIETLTKQIDPIECPNCKTKFNNDNQEKIKENIKSYEDSILKIEKQINEIAHKKEVLKSPESKLVLITDGSFVDKITPLKNQLNLSRERFTIISNEIATLEERIKNISAQINQHEKQKHVASILKQLIIKALKDSTEWRYLQKATGPNGIQALELDALAPGISEKINYFLPQDPVINRYAKAWIKTTRIGGAGSKKRQIEDFKILFYDSVNGDWVPFEILGGGESVWAKKAVYGAFSIIRARQSNFKFLTIFRDEADGALHPDNKLAYFKMIEKEHIEAGIFQTVVITHSEAVQEAIGQFIELSEL